MLHVSTKPDRKNAGRPAYKDAPGFLQWLRKRPCVFANHSPCSGKKEAMHLDFAGGKGTGTKVADRYSLPSCSGHHHRQHTKGWATFIREVGTTKEALLNAADTFWRAWPGRVKWEATNG